MLISSGDEDSDEVTFISLQEARLTRVEKARMLGTIIASNAAAQLSKNSRFKGAIWAQEMLAQQGAVFMPHGSSKILQTRQDSDESVFTYYELPFTKYSFLKKGDWEKSQPPFLFFRRFLEEEYWLRIFFVIFQPFPAQRS